MTIEKIVKCVNCGFEKEEKLSSEKSVSFSWCPNCKKYSTFKLNI